MTAMLSVKNLCVDYELAAGSVHAAKDVTFDLAAGERIGFVGESGSGKTTVALALLGMLRSPGRVVAGTATLAGKDLLGLSYDQRLKQRLSKISYVPQGAMNSLNPIQTIGQSVCDGLIDHGLGLSRRDMDARVTELLGMVGLPAKVAKSYPHELSGGMKQRVCIAIAISLSPQLILADEPTSALDVVTQRNLMATMQDLQTRLGSAMILIGHDMGLMAHSVDRVVVMKGGVIVEQGPVSDILRNPQAEYTRQLIASVPQFGERRSSPVNSPELHSGRAQLLELRDVSKVFPARNRRAEPVTALHPLDLSLPSMPSILSIVGESGSGKSTLASLVLGFGAPSSGQVLYRGMPINRLSGNDLRDYRRDVQAVFQDPYSAFNPFYRVDRTLTLPLLKLGLADSKAEANKKVHEACEQVGLDPKLVLGRFAHQLSGGSASG